MSLDRLLYECTTHYRDRGFPESALCHLRWMLITHTRDGEIDFRTAYRCNRQVDELLGHFKSCQVRTDQVDPSSADAVFAFAFGYRMKQWSDGVAPTEPSEVEQNRIPGANNAVLAEQCRQLHTTHGLDLYLQFEIADAIGTGASVKYASKRVDQGTGRVLGEFINHANSKGQEIETVVAIAHRHHFERCRLLIERQSIKVIHPSDLYSGYDPLEAQPRVMSPEEFIVNDFASMAAMV